MFTESEPLAREEIECQSISSAVEKAYQLFDELRALEVWQDSYRVFKLERHRA
jgi:hypothetical protein